MTTDVQYLLTGVRVLDPSANIDGVHDVLVSPGRVELDPSHVPAEAKRIAAEGLWALPGLIDLQVHFRQPGFEYKETLETGAAAAFAGGVTTVVVMPNTKPSLDTPESVRFQMEEGARCGLRLLVAAAATEGLGGNKLTNHGALSDAGAVAITDDGLPVLDDDLMKASLEQCAANDLLFMQHAEDTRMTGHAPMTACDVSERLGVRGQPADAEGVMVERDIRLAEQTGARYHVLHTSTARSLHAIRRAKAAGIPVSCEASPHHLLLNTDACSEGDPNKKMNPPLREEVDRQALVDALIDGTVDAVATDHAPHGADEKAQGFVDAPFGVIGLETAFAALLRFYHEGRISAERTVDLMTGGPARVLRQSASMGTLVGEQAPADLCLVDPQREWEVTPETLAGRSKNSAFLGETFQGKVLATFSGGRARYLDPSLS